MSDMRRRDFITLLGGAVTWPLAVRAQQPVTPPAGGQLLAAFVARLRELGMVKGRVLPGPL